MLISPSLLSCDFANVQRDVEMLNKSQADWFHIDIMDGVFVPNISFGIPVLKAIYRHAKKPLDVHLMIENPDAYLSAFKDAGAHLLTVHYEACRHLHRTIQAIHDLEMKAGVALNPHTPVSAIEEIITDLDVVLLMSVNPGFGGQKFIDASCQKVEKLKELIVKTNSKALIEIDGGVNLKTGSMLAKAGADVIVAGSFVFNSTDPSKTIGELKMLS